MFVLTNAWSTTIRHKWRSMMLLLVAAIMMFGAVFTTAVAAASDKAHGEDYQAQAPIAVVRPTTQMKAKLKGDDPATVKKYLGLEQYNVYATSAQQIAAQQQSPFTISASLPMRQTDNAKAIAGKHDENADKTGGEILLQSLYDNSSVEINAMGKFKIVEGKALDYESKDSQNALVSKAFAKQNKLHVGDTFKLGGTTDGKTTYEFKVRGIYTYTDPVPAGNGDDARLAKDNRNNTVYTGPAAFSNNNLLVENPEGWATPHFDVGFKFENADQYQNFVKTVKNLKLPKGYEVSSPNLERYNASLKPLDKLNAMTSKLRIATYIAGGIILLLLTVLALMHRSDEIRMDMIIGVTRGRIGWQFALETLIPIIPGLIVGAVAGALCAKPLGGALADGFATPAVSGCWMAMWHCLEIVVALALIAFLRAALSSSSRIFDARTDAGSETKADNSSGSSAASKNDDEQQNHDDRPNSDTSDDDTEDQA
jgi:putative ABC transport system permease protein